MTICTFVFLAALPGAHAGHEQKIAPAELPAAITKTLDEKYPGAHILKAEREEKKSRVEYEVKFCHEGHLLEVELDPNGRLTDVDDEGSC